MLAASCTGNDTTPPAAAEPGPSTNTSPAATGSDRADYLAAARKDTTDQIGDTRLTTIGESFCEDLRAGKWDHTTIDDENIVGDLSAQLRVNIGFAAVHHLCPDQEAEYLRNVGGALGG